MTEETLFYLARQQPDPDARAAFLDQACANEPGLRARLDRLLRAGDAPDSFLDRPADHLALNSDRQTGIFPDREEPGSPGRKDAVGYQIGPYILLGGAAADRAGDRPARSPRRPLPGDPQLCLLQ